MVFYNIACIVFRENHCVLHVVLTFAGFYDHLFLTDEKYLETINGRSYVPVSFLEIENNKNTCIRSV